MKITKQQLMDIVHEELETLTEASDNINVSALSPTEISLAIGVINYFGTGSHPMATKKTLAYFKVDYLTDIIKKNKNRLEANVKKHLANLLKKLSEGVSEETINEKGSKFDHDVFFGLQKLLSTRSKNNKLKGYSSEVAHAVTDILTSVEEDRLSIGEVFRALNKLAGSADKRTPPPLSKK